MTSRTLRERHQDTTREAILDALVALLEKDGAFEFSFFELARRSGVSVRTIYRHFPTKEELFDALALRVRTRFGIEEYPTTRKSVGEVVKKIFVAFDQDAPLTRAQFQAGFALEMRHQAQKARTKAIVKVVENEAPDLPPERIRAVAGAITCLMSADTWNRLGRTLDMSGEESGAAMASAIDTLFDALVAENAAAKRLKKLARGGKK